MLVFTVSLNHTLANAMLLATSLKSFNPDWSFCLIHGEQIPNCAQFSEKIFDKIIFFSELDIPNYDSWIFQFRPYEACQAVNLLALNFILKNTDHKQIVYFSPETLILKNLDELSNIISANDFLLTPVFIKKTSLIRSFHEFEMYDLHNGLYNPFFFSINKTKASGAVVEWINDLVLDYTSSVINYKLFDYQYLFNLLPYFFKNVHVLRDSGYGASPLNVSERNINEKQPHSFYSDDKPLHFFHFIGSDTGEGRLNQEYFKEGNESLIHLWNMYDNKLSTFNHKMSSQSDCDLNYFDNAQRITYEMRLLYRQRPDLMKLFPFPRQTKQSENNFYSWMLNYYSIKNSNKSVTSFAKKIPSKIFDYIKYRISK
jgi:hypothetical protein